MLSSTSEIFKTQQFQLQKGKILPILKLAYEDWGTLNPERNNAILVCHGYTNHHHAGGKDGWFSNLIGPGKSIDTKKYYVVAANMLGSSYGSTGPASTNPSTSKPYALDFPDITVGDMVNSQVELLNYLGIKQLAAVIGNSFGGHLAFEWATEHPGKVRAVVAAVSSVVGRGDQSTVNALTDRFAKCDDWFGGQCYSKGKDSEVQREMIRFRVETLRKYGYDNKIRETIGKDPKVIEEELVRLAKPWAEEFDPNSLIVLRKAAIEFDARPQISNCKAPLLYVLSSSDNLFPPSIAPKTMQLFQDAGVNATFLELESRNGHRAPAIDWQGWADILCDFLKTNASLSLKKF